MRYAPALVEFVRTGDHVGWFPLHPRDRFVPWWGPRRRAENITFVNRTRVVIVNHETFISGRRVTTNIVRDTVIVREIASVRVMEQPLPIPTRSSLRAAERRDIRTLQRPPANILSRAAVVRTAPPPPPPTFRDKLPEIQKNQGAPVAQATALNMGLENLKTSSRRVPIRPAAVESGRGDFAPRTPGGSAPAPQPLTAPRGKKLATPQEPVITNLPQRQERRETAPTKPQPQQGRQQPEQEPQKQERQLQEQQRELERQRQLERERQQQEKQLQQQQRKEQQLRDQQQRELERQQKQPERDRQKQEKQLQEPQRKEQQQLQKEQQIQKKKQREDQPRPQGEQHKKEEAR